MAADDITAGAQPRLEHRYFFGRTRWWVVATALLLVGAGWWLTHPAALTAGGSVIEMAPDRGETRIIGDVASVARPVTITSVRPRIVAGDATVEVLACRQAVPRLRIGAGLPADVEDGCLDVAPAAGARVSPEGGWYLIAQVTRHSNGPVRIDGFDVTYRDGVRRGAQTAGITVRLRPSAD